MKDVTFFKGDITKLAGNFEAIVNAANSSLLGGGGVDGCIHYAAGPKLLEECKSLNGCETGHAKTTKAYKLPCKYVIHAVGPNYNKMDSDEASELLYSAYRSVLDEAVKYNIKSIAFPSISTGIYGFPISLAPCIAKKAVEDFETEFPNYDLQISWVLFSDADYEAYKYIFNNTEGV